MTTQPFSETVTGQDLLGCYTIRQKCITAASSGARDLVRYIGRKVLL